jgi:hypothetical protein
MMISRGEEEEQRVAIDLFVSLGGSTPAIDEKTNLHTARIVVVGFASPRRLLETSRPLSLCASLQDLARANNFS